MSQIDVPAPGSATSAAPPTAPAYGEQSKVKIIVVLMVVYTFNYMDRVIFASVGEAVKQDLALSDFQLGLLGGLAFAAFYTLFGVPLARVAERVSRVGIIAVCVAVWSAMTALCGTAQTYWQLLMFRMGVGVGEAGFTPTVVSLISDYFPPNRRATAYSVIILAVPLGSFIAASLGGWIVEHYGWRTVFYVIGPPGMLLGLLVWFTLREPPRGHSDGKLDTDAVPSMLEVLRYLGRKPAFIHLTLGAALIGFVAYGNNFFLMPFLVRNFALDHAEAGMLLGIILAVSASVGTLSGGLLCDWAGRRNLQWYAWLPALGLLGSWPFYVLALLQSSLVMAVILMVLGSITFYAFLPTTQTVTQGLVRPKMRASTSALHGLASAMLGLAAGPAFLGFASDLFAQRSFGLASGGGNFSQICEASAPSANFAGHCAAATAEGIQYALITASLGLVWAAFHYIRAAKTLKAEIISPYEQKID
ncbi:MAG: MFS transporter [Porticoccaceae bacterium]|nr:MFS transporter [Porticoccaceae bacterium]